MIINKIMNDLSDYFKRGNTMTDFIFNTLMDHFQSQALLFGMWGNLPVSMANDMMAKWLKNQYETIKKSKSA